MEDNRRAVDYSVFDKPFVIRSSTLSLWPSFNWTLKDWSQKCEQKLFSFRVHRRDSDYNWENEAIDKFDTFLNYFNQWLTSDAQKCDNANPFKKYPKSQYWVYSSYNHMQTLLADIPEVMRSVDWTQLDLGFSLDTDAKNSTLWIGSEGAYTPCHQDSYGYNFVAQLSGKKQWILFPPTDTNNLYPTRIPYEESSVFSSVNFQRPDHRSHPLFRQTSPHVIELSAGDVLFVPHLWWHFVRVTEEDPDKSCISINTWIDDDCYESWLSESIVRLVSTALFASLSPTQSSTWLNTGADLFTAQEALHSIDLMLKKCISERRAPNMSAVKILPKNAQMVQSLSFDQLDEVLWNNSQNKRTKLEESKANTTSSLSAETVVNCVLHPDVIALIVKKLVDASINR